MNPATNLELARTDPTHLLHPLAIAIANQAAANQAVDDLHTTLRKRGWGKIEKLDWDGDYESDDQGGTTYYIHGTGITIAGERYSLGSTLDDSWEGLEERIEESRETEGTPTEPFDVIVAKLDLLAISDEREFHEHLIAELAGISEEELAQFLWIAERLVEEDRERGQLEFTS